MINNDNFVLLFKNQKLYNWIKIKGIKLTNDSYSISQNVDLKSDIWSKFFLTVGLIDNSLKIPCTRTAGYYALLEET